MACARRGLISRYTHWRQPRCLLGCNEGEEDVFVLVQVLGIEQASSIELTTVDNQMQAGQEGKKG